MNLSFYKNLFRLELNQECEKNLLIISLRSDSGRKTGDANKSFYLDFTN